MYYSSDDEFLLLMNYEKLSPSAKKKVELNLENQILKEQKLDRKNRILGYITNGNKQEVLSNLCNEPRDSMLIWITPTAELQRVIKSNVTSYAFNGVCSVGCGTGILEWLLYKEELDVCGIESEEQFTQ